MCIPMLLLAGFPAPRSPPGGPCLLCRRCLIELVLQIEEAEDTTKQEDEDHDKDTDVCDAWNLRRERVDTLESLCTRVVRIRTAALGCLLRSDDACADAQDETEDNDTHDNENCGHNAFHDVTLLVGFEVHC